MQLRLQACLFSVACLTFVFHGTALTPDGKALLRFKAQLNDANKFLSNWNESSAKPCGWTGVSCDPGKKRVIALNLPYMHLGGTISPSIGALGCLQRLALHGNMLHGFIPSAIAHCTELRALYLRNNYLGGGIPAVLGRLSYLMILDLSSNSLRGSIPPSIGKLDRLKFLNLSSNSLSGKIPKAGVLQSFSNHSFLGNLGLCGQQLHTPCKNDLGFPAVIPDSDSDRQPGPSRRVSSRYSNGILIGSMVATGVILIGLLFFVWLFCFVCKKNGRVWQEYTKIKQPQQPDAKLVMFHGDLPYTSQEFIKRIEMLGDGDIIGSGSFGTVYKLAMDDTSALAVKKIKNSGVASDRLFERELEILGSIKHRNLVNLRGYCNSSSAKLLIYDYLPLGSLDVILHERKTPLNWNARLRISVGAARGLAYLHHACYPRIVHRDVKSSNILLDEKAESHVSDFGLAKLLEDDETHVTTVVAGTFGYLAPEYLQSGRATEKSDVYSFGVVLLELFSGKRPTDPCFVAKGLNVVGWVNTLVRENRLEDIVDPECECSCKQSTRAVLQIVVMCIAPVPEERPTMNRVVQMLEAQAMPSCPSDLYDYSTSSE